MSLRSELFSIDRCSFEITIAYAHHMHAYMHDSQRMTVCGPPYIPYEVRTYIIRLYGVRSIRRFIRIRSRRTLFMCGGMAIAGYLRGLSLCVRRSGPGSARVSTQ